MIKSITTKFCIGQIVLNPQFHFRGVIIDVDAEYTGTPEWYEVNMPHKPPKNEPWYHLLIHDSPLRMYLGESNLVIDRSGEPIYHPETDYFFSEFKEGIYLLRRSFAR